MGVANETDCDCLRGEGFGTAAVGLESSLAFFKLGSPDLEGLVLVLLGLDDDDDDILEADEVLVDLAGEVGGDADEPFFVFNGLGASGLGGLNL